MPTSAIEDSNILNPMDERTRTINWDDFVINSNGSNPNWNSKNSSSPYDTLDSNSQHSVSRNVTRGARDTKENDVSSVPSTSLMTSKKPPKAPRTTQKTETNSKGRRTSKLYYKRSIVEDEPADERRKVQVKLAQRAYRQRKEDALADLREECHALRSSINNLHEIFNNFYTTSYRSNIAQQDPVHMAHIERTARLLADVVKKAMREEGDMTTTTTDSSTASAKPSSTASFPNLEVSQIKPLSSNKSLSDVGNVNMDASWMILSPDTVSEDCSSSTGHILFGAQTGLGFSPDPCFNLLLPSPVGFTETTPFSRRLQHYALERGYELITNFETPLSILRYAFKHCIRVSSRDDITSRLEHLLQQSLQGVVLGPPKDLPGSSMSSQQSFLNKLFELTDPPALSAPPPLPVPDLEAGVSILPGDEYLGAKDVETYLHSRGIMVSSKSRLIQLKIPENIPSWQPKTYRTVVLSENRLLDNILDRAVCLSTGPGFKKCDVESALEISLRVSI